MSLVPVIQAHLWGQTSGTACLCEGRGGVLSDSLTGGLQDALEDTTGAPAWSVQLPHLWGYVYFWELMGWGGAPGCLHPDSLSVPHSLHKVLFTEQPETYYKWDNWPPESDRK